MTERLRLHRSPNRWAGGKGTWFRTTREDGYNSAKVCCPECGEFADLDDHDIDEDGAVEPSVVCPRAGCAFHAFVMLLGW